LNFFRRVKKLPFQDHFIRRLPSSVLGQGMLHDGNLYLMDYAIRNMPVGGNVLEIGSWGGLSANLQLYLMRKYGRTEPFLGCDPWIYEGIHDEKQGVPDGIDGANDVKRTDYMDYIMKAYIHSVRMFHPQHLPYAIRATSDAFFELYDQKADVIDVFDRKKALGGSISYCYVDGNHAYDFVKRDFENAARHLLPGGFILFDDSWDGSNFGSTLLMDEIKKNRMFKIVDKNPNYLIRKL